MSLCLSRKLYHHFWQEIRHIKVIKCPPNSSPQREISSYPKTNLKDKLNTNANFKVTMRWFRFGLRGRLRDIYTK